MTSTHQTQSLPILTLFSVSMSLNPGTVSAAKELFIKDVTQKEKSYSLDVKSIKLTKILIKCYLNPLHTGGSMYKVM